MAGQRKEVVRTAAAVVLTILLQGCAVLNQSFERHVPVPGGGYIVVPAR